MKYNIKQQVFSFGDNFTIKNEYDEPVLIVKGKAFSLADKLSIFDLHMNELFYIEQKAFTLLPEYFIYQNNEEIAHLKKEFSFFKPKINIRSNYGSFSIDGDINNHNFTVKQDGISVAAINKKFFSLGDYYTLELFVNKNIDFLITLVIIIDQMLQDGNNN